MSRTRRTEDVLAYILPQIRKHHENISSEYRPFILGLTGLQGCGKSTLATDIVQSLNETHHIRALEVSLDDFYLTHDERKNLGQQNKLLRVRGQPGTHDVKLAELVLGQFSADTVTSADARKSLGVDEGEVILPVFDKSLRDGDGDRVARESWRTIKREPRIQVIVFEGWCVGFRPCSEKEVRIKWEKARATRDRTDTEILEVGVDPRFSTTTLAEHSLEDLLYVNEQLRNYYRHFMGPTHFDFLVHLDTLDLVNVYTWRMQQEHALRQTRNGGMTDDQVIQFVKGYMPSYELYLDDLREGFFKGALSSAVSGRKQLHIILDTERNIVGMKDL